MPFVIYFNSFKQLVQPPLDEGPQILNKYGFTFIYEKKTYFHRFENKNHFVFRVAILPLSESAYCINREPRLRGGLLLQERHLGILGYDVIQVGYREWNSIHMGLPGAREGLLRNFLKKYKLLIE